jgi:hypothetical protein
MDEKEKTKQKLILTRWAIALGVIIVVLIAGGLIAREIFFTKILQAINNQPGVSVKVGAHKGGPLHGYTLTDLSMHQNPSGGRPGSGFSTPSLIAHWNLMPFNLSLVKWDDAKYTLEPEGKNSEEFPISSGVLLPSTDPTMKGWLVTEKPITIGPESWGGNATFKIRGDGKQIEGKIHIDRLPAKYLSLATEIPKGFEPIGDLILDLDISGSPENIQASGTVSDPGTWNAFRF